MKLNQLILVFLKYKKLNKKLHINQESNLKNNTLNFNQILINFIIDFI